MPNFAGMKQKEAKAKDLIGFISTLDDWYQDGATVEQVTTTKVILRMKNPITQYELTNSLCCYLQEKGLSYSKLRVEELEPGVFRLGMTADLKTLSSIRLDDCDVPSKVKDCSEKRLLSLIEKYYPDILDKIKDGEHRCFQTSTHYFVETDNNRYSFEKIYKNGR